MWLGGTSSGGGVLNTLFLYITSTVETNNLFISYPLLLGCPLPLLLQTTWTGQKPQYSPLQDTGDFNSTETTCTFNVGGAKEKNAE
jgi:hypothetical protein